MKSEAVFARLLCLADSAKQALASLRLPCCFRAFRDDDEARRRWREVDDIDVALKMGSIVSLSRMLLQQFFRLFRTFCVQCTIRRRASSLPAHCMWSAAQGDVEEERKENEANLEIIEQFFFGLRKSNNIRLYLYQSSDFSFFGEIHSPRV
jgi:hypothetical protein